MDFGLNDIGSGVYVVKNNSNNQPKKFLKITHHKYTNQQSLNLLNGICIGYGDRIFTFDDKVYYQTWETNEDNTFFEIIGHDAELIKHNLNNLFELV